MSTFHCFKHHRYERGNTRHFSGLLFGLIFGLMFSSGLKGATPVFSISDETSRPLGFLANEKDENVETSEVKKKFWVTDSSFKMRLSGKFHLDFTDGKAIDTALPYDVSFRRLRVALKGKKDSGLHFEIQCDFSDDGSAEWKDAYVGVALGDSIDLRLGQMKEPIGLESLTGSNDLLLAERAPQTELTPKREVGVQVFGNLGVVRRALGYFLNSDDLGHAADDDEESGRRDITTRLTWMPWGQGKVRPIFPYGNGCQFSRLGWRHL